ncbi:MAG: hypothetical protein PWQ77_1748 [Kosmotogales bacterium]|nr:hypothetical protein [Kosmotogales bacterium]
MMVIMPLLFILFSNVLFPWRFSSPLTNIIGSIFIAAGIFYAFISIGDIYFTGWGTAFIVNPPKRVVKSGVYSQCRHPFYFGFSSYILGLFLVNANILLIPIYLIYLFVILIKTYSEEKSLKKKFKEEYEEYAKSTPIFIPIKKYIKGRCPSIFFLILYFFAKPLLAIIFRFKIEGREEIPDENFVVISNHGNFIDPAFVMYALNKYIRFSVSENYYKRFPFLMNVGGAISIKKHEKDPGALMNMIRLSREGNITGFYPEATRTWDSRPLEPKYGISKLLKILNLPIISIRMKGNHLSMPKWSKKFGVSKIEIKIKRFYDPEDAIRFCLSMDVSTPEETYKDYSGIEKYLWACPKCGSLKIKGSKEKIECEDCGFSLTKPKIKDLWKYHDSLSDKVNLPLKDFAKKIDIYKKETGENVKIELTDKGLLIDDKPVDIKTVIMDGNKDIHIYINGHLQGYSFENTNALMWKEMIKKVYGL